VSAFSLSLAHVDVLLISLLIPAVADCHESLKAMTSFSDLFLSLDSFVSLIELFPVLLIEEHVLHVILIPFPVALVPSPVYLVGQHVLHVIRSHSPYLGAFYNCDDPLHNPCHHIYIRRLHLITSHAASTDTYRQPQPKLRWTSISNHSKLSISAFTIE
jgi:hypothetical protein